MIVHRNWTQKHIEELRGKGTGQRGVAQSFSAMRYLSFSNKEIVIDHDYEYCDIVIDVIHPGIIYENGLPLFTVEHGGVTVSFSFLKEEKIKLDPLSSFEIKKLRGYI